MANSKNSKQKQNKKPTPKKPVTHSKKALVEFEEQQRLMDLEAQANKNRIISIIIFAFSVLFFFVAVIPGENFWNDVHNVYIGLFGWMASIVFPLLSLIYSFLVQKNKIKQKDDCRTYLHCFDSALYFRIYLYRKGKERRSVP